MSTQVQISKPIEPITSGVRSKMVDIVKGIAIVLVIYGHTAQGLLHRSWWTGPTAIFSDTFVYSFHMPAFFVVAGLFVMSSLAKRGGRQFVTDKLRTILYPYLVFAVIIASLEPFVGQFKLSTIHFSLQYFLVYIGTGKAGWFLYALFFCLMLALITARVPAWLRCLAAALVGLLRPSPSVILNEIISEFFFLSAGMWVGLRIFRLEQMRATTAALCIAVLLTFQSGMCLIYKDPIHWGWVFMVLGLTGTTAVFLVARLLDQNRVGDVLAWLGEASLAIFLLGQFVQGATREILLRGFHTQEFWLQLLLPTVFSLLLPAIVWHQRDRFHLGWLFRSPV